MKPGTIGLSIALVAIAGCISSGAAGAAGKPVAPPVALTPGLYFVDAHSQFDHNVDEERVISLMDRGGVHRTIVSTHMRRPWSDIPEFAARHPGRIVPAVQIKGRGYHKRPGPRAFHRRLSRQMGHGGFRAMAEILLWHDSAGGKFQEIRVGFDDELVLAAFEQAKSRGWPFIVHIEFASLSADGRKAYMDQLEAFLRHNPDHPFAMIHMGQLQAGPVGRLLAAHANLYFMTSHASPFYQGRGKPFINMMDGDSLKPQWRDLMTRYPDRFVFALDNVFSRFWMPDLYLGKMKLWWRALSELPDEVAHAVAHGNAERLWKLAPKPAEIQVLSPWQSPILGPVRGHSEGRMRR